MQSILTAGVRLQDRYRIERPISAGAMGEVYKATELSSGQAVAVKRLILTIDDGLAAAGGQDYHFKRFREEINVLRNLDFQGIPRFIDEFSEAGQQFIVMEFIDGIDLERQLRDHVDLAGELPDAGKVIRYLIDVCKIVEYLHALRPQPIIHRDIKPANIILRHSDQRLYLVDFGLARAVGQAESTKTSVGTVGYAPIEQYQGKPREQSDEYSLAVTLHFMLSGIPPIPFQLEPLDQCRPGLPPVLYQAVRRAINENFAERWDSVYSFRRELEKASKALSSGGAGPAHSSIPIGTEEQTTKLDDSLLNAIMNRKVQRQKLEGADSKSSDPADKDLEDFATFDPSSRIVGRPGLPRDVAMAPKPWAQASGELKTRSSPAASLARTALSLLVLFGLGMGAMRMYSRYKLDQIGRSVLPSDWTVESGTGASLMPDGAVQLVAGSGWFRPRATTGLTARALDAKKFATRLDFRARAPRASSLEIDVESAGRCQVYQLQVHKDFTTLSKGMEQSSFTLHTPAPTSTVARSFKAGQSVHLSDKKGFDHVGFFLRPGSEPVDLQAIHFSAR